jgi:hypothetical protein
MNVEIGAEAAQFPKKEYINGIAFAVYYNVPGQNMNIFEVSVSTAQVPFTCKQKVDAIHRTIYQNFPVLHPEKGCSVQMRTFFDLSKLNRYPI